MSSYLAQHDGRTRADPHFFMGPTIRLTPTSHRHISSNRISRLKQIENKITRNSRLINRKSAFTLLVSLVRSSHVCLFRHCFLLERFSSRLQHIFFHFRSLHTRSFTFFHSFFSFVFIFGCAFIFLSSTKQKHHHHLSHFLSLSSLLTDSTFDLCQFPFT